jgi:glycosyltransferase involved in cell wall biosynthesis
MPNVVVTDARVIEDYYRRRYRCPSTFIPYGCSLERAGGTDVLDRFGLAAGQYVLYVSRLEPENNAHAVIAAHEASIVERPLVIVGDAPYARDYIAALRRQAGPRVVFTGGVYGTGYHQLQSHAFCYVHATEVGGTHPALVEAMGFGNAVLVNDVPENREVAGDAALYFDVRDPRTLAVLLQQLDHDPTLLDGLRARASARARARFSWEHITDEYEQLFQRLQGGPRSLAA